MKITHHKDGSYSITGMNREDVSRLNFALGAAATWYVLDKSVPHDDFRDDQIDAYEKLEKVMRTVADSRTTGSIVVTNDPWTSVREDRRYTVQPRKGLLSWEECDNAREAAGR